MKILWISHLVPYPPKAGVLIRAHHLVKELSKYHEVDLIAFNQRGLMEPYFNTYEEGTRQSRAILENFCRRVEFHDCPTDKSRFSKYWCALKSLFTKFPYTIAWLQSTAFKQRVEELHQTHHYDLIHCDTISLAPYIDNIKNTPLSLDHHNVESHMLLRRAQMESNPLKKFYYWQEGNRLVKFEKKYCPLFSTNITCSELDNDRFRQFIPNARYQSIPNGVDIDFFRPGDERRNSHIIFIGTLDWYPNIRAVNFIANDIWPILKRRRPEIVVDIVGSKPPQELVALGQRDERFNVHGFVDDIMPLLNHATAYVCPINDGGGTKLKLLDAFAAGKAVVADPIACEGLLSTDGENVLYAETAEQFVSQIERLFDDESLRLNIEKNARGHAVNHFSFTAIGKSLADHFQSLGNKD